MDCCSEILNLGCIYSCDLVQIGSLTPITGVYIIELQPSGTRLSSTTNTAGTPLIFANRLNEDAVSVFKIVDPNGNYFTNSNGYDCFQVTVSPAFNTTLADVDVDPVTCAAATVKNSDNSFSTTVASGATLTLADTTYNIYISGNLTQSFTIPTLKTETVNVYP